MKAAGKLGVDKGDIREVRNWDGEEELGDEMVVDEAEIPWPSNFVQELYQQAIPELGRLCDDPVDSRPMRVLEDINKKIREQNEKNGNKPDLGTIDYKMYAVQFNSVKPYRDRILNTPEGQPLDQEAISKIVGLNDQLKKLNQKHHFPEHWIVTIPTEEERLAHIRAKEAEQAAAAQVAAAQAAAEQAAAEQAAAEQAAAAQAAAEQAVAEQAAVAQAAAEKGGKFGNIKFPWVTHLLPTGERIIAGRQRTKDDVAGSLCCVELPCTNPEDPTFEFRDDIDVVELQKYFATPNIKLMGETDEQGRPVKVWSKADRKDFRKFIFCVVGKRQRSDLRARTKPVCPEVLCCIEMADGITVVNKTALLRIVGQKSEEGYIRRYCKDKGITAPWDVEPETYIISKEMKKKVDAVNSGAGSSVSGWTAVSLPSANSEIKSLQDQMANLERKLSSFQPSTTSGNSLDSILAKLEGRMASIETKVAKVDALEEATTKLAGYLTALSNKFDKLEKNVQS